MNNQSMRTHETATSSRKTYPAVMAERQGEFLHNIEQHGLKIDQTGLIRNLRVCTISTPLV